MSKRLAYRNNRDETVLNRVFCSFYYSTYKQIARWPGNAKNRSLLAGCESLRYGVSVKTTVEWYWGEPDRHAWSVFIWKPLALIRSMAKYVCLSIVIRGDSWLWKAANINDKNNSAAVYVGSTLKVHNPLFSVGKLLRNKLMQRFYWLIQSKW